MIETIQGWMQIPVVRDALIGLWGALYVDLVIWIKATGWNLDGFVWSTATKRWVSGLIVGALAGAGINIVS